MTLPAIPWQLTRLVVGPMSNNCYILNDFEGTSTLIIDASDEPSRILAAVPQGHDVAIVTTHRHRDHWEQALADVVASTGATTYAGHDDADAITVPTDVRLAHGDVVRVGGILLGVIHLRGHTPGSIALVHEAADAPAVLFSGDSLFPGGVGKTQSRADFEQLFSDVTQRLFDRFPDDTAVLPGHGEGTTLGAERPQLAQWRERGW